MSDLNEHQRVSKSRFDWRETVARDWLAMLVDKEKVAFATQKQALNALVFFFRDVCGREEIDLQVKMRKTGQRQPVILTKSDLMGLIGKLEDRYKTPALLQYGAGLRLKELANLLIKDVDLERGVVTIHAGKGDKDRLTVLPNALKDALRGEIAKSREFWEDDRAKKVASTVRTPTRRDCQRTRRVLIHGATPFAADRHWRRSGFIIPPKQVVLRRRESDRR